MRTYNIHKQKPLLRYKETHLAKGENLRDIVNALQAVCDSFAGTDSLILAQCQSALDKAKKL